MAAARPGPVVRTVVLSLALGATMVGGCSLQPGSPTTSSSRQTDTYAPGGRGSPGKTTTVARRHRHHGQRARHAHHQLVSGSGTSGNAAASVSWSLLTEPADGLSPIYSMMSGARHTLDMTMYELADPQAISILEADAARGVVVRVLLDRAYSGQYVNAPDLAALSAHGVEVRWAPAGTIFHQKTITVDDHESAIMTLNLTSRYYATSRDFAVLTTDPTDVSAIEQTFSADWSGDAVGTGAPGGDLVWSPGATSRLLALIDSARHSLLVENEEMADPAVTSALEAAARRGVAVDLVMTASSSWDSAFGALEAASVEVHTYPSTAALYIHAKVVVADGTTAFVGSQNFSVSSLEYNRELGLVTTDPALVGALERTLSSDFAGAEAFSPPTPTTGRPTTPGTTPSGSGAWCSASAASANDGYSGDYDVTVTSNQPDQQATASDPGDTYSRVTDSGGSATIRLWHTTPGETITISVGGAHCTTTA